MATGEGGAVWRVRRLPTRGEYLPGSSASLGTCSANEAMRKGTEGDVFDAGCFRRLRVRERWGERSRRSTKAGDKKGVERFRNKKNGVKKKAVEST